MIREITRAGSHRHLLGAAVLLGLAWSADAHAKNTAAADDVREAKLLMEQKRYNEACSKIAESHRREPSGEKIFELGRCHYEQGRIATAYYELREALDIAKRDGRWDRIKPARAMLEDIEPKLPKLNVSVSVKASSIPGFEVKRDGMPIRPQEWGTDFPADPGTHTILATAPGHQPLLKTIELRPDGTTEHIGVLNLDPAGPKPKAETKTAAPLRPEADRAKSPWPVQRTAGVVFGGVGVAALGAGAVLGIRASSVQSASDAHCKGSVCDPEGKSLRSSAETLGTTSTLMLIGGGVAAAGGLMLFLTAPQPAAQERATTAATTSTTKGPAITHVGVGPTGGFINGQW